MYFKYLRKIINVHFGNGESNLNGLKQNSNAIHYLQNTKS